MKMLSRVSLAGALALLLAMSACSDDDNDIVTPPPGDTTPPTVTTVTPVNSFQFDVTFNEEVTKTSAENPAHYFVTETGTPIHLLAMDLQYSPGDTIHVASSVLKPDKKSVTVTTWDSMAGINCNLSVQGVADASGNVIETPVDKLFTGSSDPDVIPPGIASRFPAPGATGVATNVVITVQFTEPVSSHDFDLLKSAVPVPFIEEQLDATSYRLMPTVLLEFNTTYTMRAVAIDGYANSMPQAQWSFTTLGSTDTTPPRVVSTSPANNAVNVNVNANLSITFSEAIDQSDFEVTLVPQTDGNAVWSNGGKTVTLDPFNPLLDDQQYVLAVLPGGVFDLVGNSIAGVHMVVFSTGPTLENGRISGTIAGHPGSEAADPTGATVVAVDGELFTGSFNVLAATTVAGNDTYSLTHLGDRVYWILAILDTAGDETLEPGSGDAIGAYGVDFGALDLTPDSVVVTGGAQVGGINFALYDPSAIEGTVTYDGVYAEGDYYAYVGLFEVAGFDPQNPGEPVAAGEAFWPLFPQWGINSLDQPIPTGDYYVAAFLDVIVNGAYDVGQEPAGIYGGISTPTSVHIMNGNDIGGIEVPLVDPAPGITSVTVAWPKPVHNPLLKRIQEIARRGQSMAN